MQYKYQDIFTRNLGLFTEAEQEKIRKSSIAIAGVGGIGGLAAERLIRLGVGKLKMTDPGDMEASNLNRQFGSSTINIGHNKAEVAYELIKDINPQAKITYTKTGIRNADDASRIVEDCDFLIDVMDFGLFRQSILLQRAARRKGIHDLFSTAIGFGAIAVVFDPKGITLEEYDGLSNDVDVDNPANLKVSLDRILPVIPAYANDMTVINDIMAGKRTVPTSSIGAGLAAILTASETINVILGKEMPKAPQYTFFDIVDRQLVVGKVGNI
jgi:molybdopterin/thiamine biosynthesis adenylyltransferase